MAERFISSPETRARSAGVPPIALSPQALPLHELPPAIDMRWIVPQQPTREAPDTQSWNREQVKKMWDYQKATETACFFASLYSTSAVLRPEVELPDADWYLANIRPWHGEVLDEEKLLVKNSRLAQALQIYEDWGIGIKRITRNNKAKELLQENLAGLERQGLVTDTNSKNFIDISRFQPPCVVWMHEGVSNKAHFIAVDGTDEAMEMVRKYEQEKKFFVKMVIEVEEKGVGKRGAGVPQVDEIAGSSA